MSNGGTTVARTGGFGQLEAMEGRRTSVEATSAHHDEQRLDFEELERRTGSLPADDY